MHSQLNSSFKVFLEALEVLKPGGIIAFEIGYNQKVEVMNLLKEYGYENIQSYQDLAGKDRVVIGFKAC